MKKITAVLLSISALAWLFVFPVGAEPKCVDTDYYRNNSFFAECAENHRDEEIVKTSEGGYNHFLSVDQYIYFCYDLKELYYHTDNSGNTDWLLFKADGAYEATNEMIDEIFGDRFLSSRAGYVPFTYQYGIYNISEDKFYDIEDVYGEPGYENIDEAFAECNVGTLLGDVNYDGIINIIDATLIQKYSANLLDYPKNDSINVGLCPVAGKSFVLLKYNSDMNRDGKRNVSDATAVQKYCARLDYRVYVER